MHFQEVKRICTMVCSTDLRAVAHVVSNVVRIYSLWGVHPCANLYTLEKVVGKQKNKMDHVIPAAATEILISSSETGKKTCKEVWWTFSLSTSRERDDSRLDAGRHVLHRVPNSGCDLLPTLDTNVCHSTYGLPVPTTVKPRYLEVARDQKKKKIDISKLGVTEGIRNINNI
jgi:hypothetical protein